MPGEKQATAAILATGQLDINQRAFAAAELKRLAANLK
jgi:hypothetical protein